jgi:hypothetical protein
MSLDLAKTFLKRAIGRRYINAWIRQTGSFATQQCRVIEVSRTNVSLEFENARSIPDKFLLSFSKSASGHHATVVWRRGTQVGAEFASPLTTLALRS